jgi:exodeoxyribonuclease-5
MAVSDSILSASPGEVVQMQGVAGSGKSTMLPKIIERLGFHPEDVAFTAPTGKAAKVATTKLQQSGIPAEATTIHKAIYRPKPLKAEVLHAQLKDAYKRLENSPGLSEEEIAQINRTIHQIEHDLDKAYAESDSPKFQLNPDSMIGNRSLIVVDEASMVGLSMAEDLRSFGVPILAIGDPKQLPPVGDEPGLLLGRPHALLEEIHRQAADNPIIALSKAIREGKTLRPGNWGDQVELLKRSDDYVTTNDELDVQVICGKNDTRWKLTKKIRKSMGLTQNGPAPDEPLIVCRNSRKMPDLVNGTFVASKSDVHLTKGDSFFYMTVEDETGRERRLFVYQGLFEEHEARQKGHYTANKFQMFQARRDHEHLDWGWAITCHKSQGSQWPGVVVHNEAAVFREDAAKWLYTAVTRASENLWVIL